MAAVVIVNTGCSKAELPEVNCKRVYYLSDRYTLDTVYLKTDTLWPYGRYHNDFCGSDTLQFTSKVSFLLLCADSTYEIKRWVVGDVASQPKIFK